MSSCPTIAAMGLGLQMLGALLALIGLVEAFRRMGRLPASVHAMGTAARATTRLARRAYRSLPRLSRKLTGWPKDRPVNVRISHHGIELSHAGSLRAYKERRHNRLDRRVDQLREDVRALERRFDDVREELKGDLSDERKAREEGDRTARQFAGDLLARALDMEIYATGFILLGVALSVGAFTLC